MDSQDSRKITQSGHENHGVYLCQKCGWPFPNAHPSAKHRRAHKRICGTIEGYRLIDSEENSHSTVSDDEHSDEDHKTPSPKMEKRSNNEGFRGGVGERSNRSEDDVFSDAVTEFSDAGPSPGIEELLEDAKESISKVVKIANNDPTTTQSIKDGAITEIIQPPNSSTESSQMQNAQVPESMSNQLGSAPLPQDRVPSPTIGSMASAISDSGTKESAVVLSDDKNSSACDLYPIKPITSTDAPQENKETNAGEDVTKCCVSFIGMESDVKGNEVNNLEENLLDIAVSPSETSEAGSKLEEMNGNTSEFMADGTVLSKEEKSDLSPEVQSVLHVEPFVDVAQVQVDTAQGLDFASSGDTIEGCNTNGEGNQNVHVLSVPDDIHVVDHPEIMVKDFKDHKALKLNLPVTLDSCEAIRGKEDDVMDPVIEENCSSFQSRQLTGGIDVSSSDFHALEDKVNQEGGSGELMVEEVPVPVEQEEIKGTISENLLSDELGTADAARIEIEKNQTVCSPEEQEPQDFCNDLSKKIIPENPRTVLTNVNPMVFPMDAEVNQMTNLVGEDNAGGYEKARTKKCDIAGDEGREGATENTKTTPESGNNLCESQINQTTNLLGGDDVGDHESIKNKIYDSAGNGSMEGSTEEIPYTKTTPESEGSLSEFQVVEDGVDQSASNLPKTDFAHLDRVSDSSSAGIDVSHLAETHTNLKNCQDGDPPEGVEELQINSGNKVQVECVGAVDTVAESNNGVDVQSLQKTSEDQMIKDPLLSSVDPKSSVQSSATVEDEHAKVLDQGASGIGCESLQEEGDNNLSKQQLGVSADSSSQTVSDAAVFSTQSDAPVIVNAEALPSTDSQPSAKVEKAVLKKSKDGSEGHSDKSDIFEPPSFMKLVEPSSGGDQKAASEIQTVQNPQQKNSASLQAGWFPSLTNVVKDSQGRKNNEEIIAKVTNWSTGKQHTPSKNLLGEVNLETKPKSPNPKENPTPVVQKDGIPTKNNDALATMVNSILGPEAPVAEAAKGETQQEWNSPARYPADNKREKRKGKGKPYWIPFVCCSSVN